MTNFPRNFLHTFFMLSVIHWQVIWAQDNNCTSSVLLVGESIGSGSGSDDILTVSLCTDTVVPSTPLITTEPTVSITSSSILLSSTNYEDVSSLTDFLLLPSLSLVTSLPNIPSTSSLSSTSLSSTPSLSLLSTLDVTPSPSFLTTSSSSFLVSSSLDVVETTLGDTSSVLMSVSNSMVGVSSLTVGVSSSMVGVSSSSVIDVSSSSMLLTPSMMSSIVSSSVSVVPSSVGVIPSSVGVVPSSVGVASSSMLSSIDSTPSLSPSPSQFSITSSLTPSHVTSSIPVVIGGTSTSVTTVIPTVTSTPPPPTDSPFQRFIDLFNDVTIIVVVAVGGFVILLLIIIILAVICFCCCCRRRKDKYSIEEHHHYSNGNLRGTRYRPSISAPQQSYHHELQQVKEERQRLQMFAETELGDVSIDDALHYQGHSQVQHSQLHNGGSLQEVGPITTTTQQSLSKLTPLNPSQIILQAGGGISVDDDEDELPLEQENSQRGRGEDPRENGGGDSPFMHLSDNLPLSRNRSQTKLLESEDVSPHKETHERGGTAGETSQVSYLGLGVMHGSDVVFTNSMADDNILNIGMVGINKELLLNEASSQQGSGVERSIDDSPLDEKPTRESSRAIVEPSSRSREIALLTSLESSATSDTSDKPVRGKMASPQRSQSLTVRTNTLSAMTSLTALTTPTSGDSDLQETPERQRRFTVSTPEESFRRSSALPTKGGAAGSRLGKLTSLEYIRASLRMKLKKMKAAKDEPSPENPKKPFKSAMRKSGGSVSSYDSSTSPNTFINRHATEYDDSPHHFPPNSPQFTYPMHNPHEYMTGSGYHGHPAPYHDPMGGAYLPPHGGYIDHGFPISPHLVAPQGPMYTEQLSPILSVSQFDYHPSMQVGLLPQYGVPMGSMMGGGYPGDYYPSQPPNYDDDEEDEIPFRENHPHGDMNVSASQRNVTWNLQHQEIPPRSPVDPEDVSLTLSDEDDDR